MFRKLICLFRRFKFWIRLKITHSSFTLDDFKKLVESTKKMEDMPRLDLSYSDYLKFCSTCNYSDEATDSCGHDYLQCSLDNYPDAVCPNVSY